MASKESKIKRNNRVVKSLLEQLVTVRKNPTEENVYELIGGTIIANRKEYSCDEVNQTITDVIRELRKVQPDRQLYEEVLIAYVNEMEKRKQNVQLEGKKTENGQSFEEIKEEIEDTIYLFYAHDLVSLDFLEKESLSSVFLTNSKLMKAYEKGKISKDKTVDFLASREAYNQGITAETQEEKYTIIAQLYNDLKPYSFMKKIRESYLSLIPECELVRLYTEGMFEGKDLRKANIKVEDILALEGEQIVKFLSMRPIPGMRDITQDDILPLYGTKLSGQDIIALSEIGKVAEEKIITLAANNSVEEISETKLLKPEDFLEYYNAERLLRLINEDKINSRFVEILNEKIIAKMPKEKVEEYYAKIISDIRASIDNEIDTTKTSLELFKIGILPSKALKDNIETLDSDLGVLAVIEDSVETDTIAKLFNEKAISVDTIKDIFLSDEIIELYNEGVLSSRALLAIPEEERNIYLDVNMEDGADETRTILELFTKYDGININEVVALLKDRVEAEEIYNNLDRTELPKEKVRELFLHYMISQDELGKLRDEGIIEAEDYETYSGELGKAEFFERLKNTKIIKATGDEAPKKRRGSSIARDTDSIPKRERISLQTRRDVLETLGGDTSTAVIQGNNSSLNGYTLVGFEDDGLVVFENFEKTNNATYVMTYQQAAYFMENIKIASSVLNEKDPRINYTGTKTELRDTENVRRKLHSKHWAKNVADAIVDLSVRASDRLKPNGKYLQEVRDMLDKSRDEYERG